MTGLHLGIGLSASSGGGSAPETALETLQRTLAGTSFAIDLTTAVDDVDFTSTDSSGLGNTLTQTTNSQEPTVSGTLGAVFDGINDNILLAISGGTYSVVMAFVSNPTNTDQVYINTDATAGAIRATSGNGTALPATTTIDGASVTTRGELFTAAALNSEVTMVATGYDLTAGTFFILSASSTALLGSCRRIVLIDEGSVTGGDLTDARAAAVTWVEES